jgi:hypothetical protein
MKRHLEESDLEQLTDEDYRLLLNQQIETHHRLREQAQSLIRMVIAGVGVIVALIGYKLFPDFQLPSRTLTIAGGAVQFNGLLQGMAEDSILVASLFGITALGLLFNAVMKSISVLIDDGPMPISRHKTLDRMVSPRFSDEAQGSLGSWILTNDVRIVEAERQVEQSFTLIWASFGMGIAALLLTGAALIGSLTLMGLIHTLLVVLGPVGAVLYFKDTILTFVNTIREDGLRSGFSAAMNVYYDTLMHRGAGPNVTILLILFYGIYVVYSYPLVGVWLQLFVL